MLIKIPKSIIKRAHDSDSMIVVNPKTRHISLTGGKPELLTNHIDTQKGPILNSLVVDASTTPSNPGPTEYRIMETDTRKVIRNVKIGITSNNVGEFLAIYEAVHYLHSTNSERRIVYSDSTIAIGWVKKGVCRSNFITTQELKDRVTRALDFFAIVNHGIQIKLWDTKSMGENFADYGRKRPYYLPY